MALPVKKAIRSMQVAFPFGPDLKYAAQNAFFSVSGLVSKKELALVRHLKLGPQDLILDIGANRGQSIIALRNGAPRARIVGFEPFPVLAARLAATYASTDAVRIEACALSDEEGSLTIYVPSYRGFVFDGMAALDRDRAVALLNADRLFWFDASKIHVDAYDVPVHTIDSFDLAPKVMKIHAQRSEIAILKGAERTIRQHGPLIVAAWVWDEEVAQLRSYGYTPCAYRGGRVQEGVEGHEFTWFLLPKHADLLKIGHSAG